MTRVVCKIGFAFALGAAFLAPAASLAQVEPADPQALYAQMKAAFERGRLHGWHLIDQTYYLAAIFNAGRAYSLQRPDDPAFGELAQLTVDVAAGVHYNPLTNHDAVPWYVREAAVYMKAHGTAEQARRASDLLVRVDAEQSPALEARLADADAAAAAHDFPGDAESLLQQVEADWRAYLLTRDTSWRTLALMHAAQSGFPAEKLPTTYGNEFITAARSAAAGVSGFSAGDAVNAKQFLAQLERVARLRLIGSINVVTHEAYMSTLAPADEYFGRTGMSVLGMRNELHRLALYLDAGYGARESNSAVLLAEAVDSLHRVYPRDRDLPGLLLATYRTLQRIDTPEARQSASAMRSILTVEYQDTQQARELLAS
ncbi:MAG: hypothetical protein NVS1B14_02840 [Vulcanimicrobiaceae bacterium]